MFDVIGNVCSWNLDRDNIEYNKTREAWMLQEELDEYMEAISEVDEADALADIIFVAIGSLFKLAGADTQKVHDIMLAVCAANDLKGRLKNEQGKIMKDDSFSGPEEMIERILNDPN